MQEFYLVQAGSLIAVNSYTCQACQVSRIARVTHAIGSFHTLTRKPGLFSRIFVHAWNEDMVSSFTGRLGS